MIEGSSGALPVRVRIRSKDAAAAQVGADLCVVGAGISGISAAVEAARLGRNVLLADAGEISVRDAGGAPFVVAACVRAIGRLQRRLARNQEAQRWAEAAALRPNEVPAHE